MRAAPLAFAAQLVLGATAVPAVTLLVPDTYATIQEAVDAAGPGDVVKVAAGVYAPFDVTGKSDLVIKGKGKPIVDGGGAPGTVVEITGSARVTLQGLVVRNNSGSARGIDVDASESVTIKRCRVADVYDALRAHASANVVVQKSLFEHIRNDAVDFSDDDVTGPAHDSQVRKNVFTDVANEAIEIEGDNHVVVQNRIERAGTAIALEDAATDAIVRKNRITTTTGDAMRLTGSGHLVARNLVAGAGEDGIVVETTGATFRGNRVDGAADDGIEVGPAPGLATLNAFTANRVQGSARNGFAVSDGGNIFTRNAATGNGVFDLADTAGTGANTYTRNRFGSEQIQ
jgi:nitrous oxidase accessory protein